MSEGVTVTVTWAIKPELAGTFIETLRGMFPETRRREGFRKRQRARASGSEKDGENFRGLHEQTATIEHPAPIFHCANLMRDAPP